MQPYVPLRVAGLTMILALGAFAPLMGQTSVVRVEAIRLAPEEHVNEIRTLEGVVERLANRAGAESPAFYLEDDFGHQLLVVPFDETPARGSRVRVTGVVSLDPVGDPVLTVFDAEGLVEAGAAPLVEAPEPAAETGVADEPRGPILPRGRTRWLLAFGLLVVLGGGWKVIAWMRDPVERPLVTGSSDVDFATSALWPESEREFEGRTLRFIRPDPTVRLMSARLEVVSGGDAGEEIRFVGRPGESVQMMFGRSPGEGEGCVHLKQKTVSRTHAVIRHRHGEWLLENLSMTNPTVLNGEQLGAKERLLTDGDRIEMGEVAFVFHS